MHQSHGPQQRRDYTGSSTQKEKEDSAKTALNEQNAYEEYKDVSYAILEEAYKISNSTGK